MTGRRAAGSVAAAAVAVALAGCGGGSGSASPAATAPGASPAARFGGLAASVPGTATPGPPAAATPGLPAALASASAPACPAPPSATLTWPAGVPADLPKPPGAVLTSTDTTKPGLTLVRFTTADSLRNGVLALVGTLTPAGYTLGRGDAEAAEADAPFSRGDLHGVYRMIARQACATDWLMALTSAAPTAATLLPPLAGAASPTPLPFG